MSFEKYSSIENIHHYTKVKDQIPIDSIWCVVEKIHGSNFSLQTSDGIKVQGGKRNSPINESELVKFNNCGEIIEKYKPHVLELFQFLKPKSNLIVYGEIFGSSYPPYPSTRKPVQKEVLYCPNIEFVVFDIKLDGKYLPIEQTNLLCGKFNFLYLKIDFKGTFAEAIAYSQPRNADLTSIPSAIFGLSEIKDNIREGNIIRPYNDVLYLKNGTRVIFKDKNALFREKEIKPKNDKQKIEIDQDEVEELQTYLVLPRWNAVVSKEGEDTNQNKLVNMFIDDAMEDYYKDSDEIVHTPAQKKILKKRAMPFAYKFVTSINPA